MDSLLKQPPVQTANLPVMVDLQRLDLHRICDGQLRLDSLEKAIFLPSENFPPAQQLYYRPLSFDQHFVEKR